MIVSFTTPETRFLSNFYPFKNKNGNKYPHVVKVSYMGLNFDCVENAYQASKCKNRIDRIKFVNITPFEAKALTNPMEFEERPDWQKARIGIMENLVWQKFYNNSHLKQMLLDTGNQELIEGNDWGDEFWGVSKDGVGHNHLGKILMMIRDELWLV